jgi:phage terminase small subunit
VSKDKSKLNIRQKKFAEYYVESGNVSQSAVKAGYSEKFAKSKSYLLLDNPLVVKYIQELSEEMQDKRIMNAKERQAVLSDIARNKSHMEETGDIIKAIDTLNKMTGEYLNKVEVSGNIETQTTKLDKILEQLNE